VMAFGTIVCLLPKRRESVVPAVEAPVGASA